MLHTLRLVDRATDPLRDFTNGKVTDFASRWKAKEVMPAHYTIVDEALQATALDTIDQILNNPTAGDQFRQMGFGGMENFLLETSRTAP